MGYSAGDLYYFTTGFRAKITAFGIACVVLYSLQMDFYQVSVEAYPASRNTTTFHSRVRIKKTIIFRLVYKVTTQEKRK